MIYVAHVSWSPTLVDEKWVHIFISNASERHVSAVERSESIPPVKPRR